jgi:hypothetical protein
MDVQVDRDRIRSEREKRAWRQEHLAGAAGIGARTIQRIEATGVASYESVFSRTTRRSACCAPSSSGSRRPRNRTPPIGQAAVEASRARLAGVREEQLLAADFVVGDRGLAFG